MRNFTTKVFEKMQNKFADTKIITTFAKGLPY